jgi:hypothetical protein
LNIVRAAFGLRAVVDLWSANCADAVGFPMKTSEIDTELRGAERAGDRGLSLPPGLVLIEQVAAALRRFLGEEGLDDYVVFDGEHSDLHDLDRHLAVLDPGARWIGHDILTGHGEGSGLVITGNPSRVLPAGVLALSRYKLVITRRFWLDNDGAWRTSFMCGAESVAEYDRFRSDLRALRNEHGARVWQVVSGDAYQDGERIVRTPEAAHEPLLPEGVMERIRCDVISFFSDEVAAMYGAMRVPYRRGVLLYGPPGNGKTSTIRYVGAMLPRVPGLILRSKANFNSDDFQKVIMRWRRMAPAILVIEDLNWLLNEVNVSNFLNLLDGVDSAATGGGLLLIATTNYPEKLDPAINSRPGRFDVVIELPPPDVALRRRFLEGALEGVPMEQIGKMAEESREMSFAHLQEVVRLAGLFAIRAGRRVRSIEDLDEALAAVRKGVEQVERGFARKLEVPFGLRPRRAHE